MKKSAHVSFQTMPFALVLGPTGATGSLLVRELLDRGIAVRAVARSKQKLPDYSEEKTEFDVIEGSILDFSDAEMDDLVKGCHAVGCCLGHNPTLRGIFGAPRRLVTDALRNVCEAIIRNHSAIPVKIVLMNTTANQLQAELAERSFKEKQIIGLLRKWVPPQKDNEQAAAYLRENIGLNHRIIEWSIVRPDSLVDEPLVSDYEVHSSIIRSPIFDDRKTSRINVAHFMAELIKNENTWSKWKGRMPVIYNAD